MTDQTFEPKVVELTQEGLEELKAELQDLKEVKLPAAIQRVAAAREHGDLSENSEYHNARDDKDLIETRISEIEDILQHAKVVAQTTSSTVVGMGSRVVIQVKGNKSKSRTIHLVGEFEADPAEGKISSVSPLGKALMGHKKSAEVVVKAPAGDVTYVIVEIK